MVDWCLRWCKNLGKLAPRSEKNNQGDPTGGRGARTRLGGSSPAFLSSCHRWSSLEHAPEKKVLELLHPQNQKILTKFNGPAWLDFKPYKILSELPCEVTISYHQHQHIVMSSIIISMINKVDWVKYFFCHQTN